MIRGKKILLGITGSIAAYKSVLLVRELVKLGAEVQVVCSPSALDFVTPITLSTLSKRPTLSKFITNPSTGEWANHVDLGKWADLMVIAPLSANSLSKLVTGQCDNLLMATYLSADCPVLVAPAMDLDMYDHWTTKNNLKSLESNGVEIIDAESGELASGLVGQGRMAEPEHIVSSIQEHFKNELSLEGITLLITAGPTYEQIDPVRFIGNYSSGKMGYAIANEAIERGARVILISGPTVIKAPEVDDLVEVKTADEMYDAVHNHYGETDAVIMTAAVSDYKPIAPYQKKQKKGNSDFNTIELTDTKDILKSLGEKKKHQKLIGFALETDNELENAHKKLKNKNLDLLVLNSLNDEGAGFGTDTNKVTFVRNSGNQSFELKSKVDVAKDILNAVEEML